MESVTGKKGKTFLSSKIKCHNFKKIWSTKIKKKFIRGKARSSVGKLCFPKKLNKNKDWVRLAAGPKIKKQKNKPPDEDNFEKLELIRLR